MKRKFRVFLGSIFLSVSIGCFFYPDYYKWKMDCKINIIEKEILEPLPQKENKEKEKNYEALYKEMEIYNQRLEIQGQNLVDAWSYEEPPIPLHFIPNEDYAVGTIEIPDMQVKLPLFLGASKENLSKGAGILSETSMPIGGRNSNCVIAAHRGWRGNPYFQYIENSVKL